MKKALIVALVASAAHITAAAQIQPEKIETPTVIAQQTMWTGDFRVIVLLPDVSPLYFLKFTTTNKYDDAMLIPLGKSVNEAIVSLENILALFREPVGSTFKLPLDNGSATVKVTKNMETFRPKKYPTELLIWSEGYAGGATLPERKFTLLIDDVKAYSLSQKNARQ